MKFQGSPASNGLFLMQHWLQPILIGKKEGILSKAEVCYSIPADVLFVKHNDRKRMGCMLMICNEYALILLIQ